jgi:uracil-DNA glycosylase
MARLFDDEHQPAPVPPDAKGIDDLRQAAMGCTACPLHKTGTQTVFGEGPDDAQIVFVGEQPGDEEDKEGEPFVGPSGRLLDQSLDEVGLDRERIYVTNAVKHFKWEPRGKRRIHQKPNAAEQASCRPWLDAELAALQPEALVLLGATAAQSLLGKSFRVTQQRGEVLESDIAPLVMATVHPSSVLRAPAEEREAARAAFVADLRNLATALHERGLA